jgi:hypothetical protein
MSIRCNNETFKVKLGAKSKLSASMTKYVLAKAKPRMHGKVKSFASLQIIGFVRGGGEQESFSQNYFGSTQNFGSTPDNSGPMLPNIMHGSFGIDFNSTRALVPKPPRLLPTELADLDHLGVLASGWLAENDGIIQHFPNAYSPETSNNHSYTYVGSPQFKYEARARLLSDSKFRVSANVPIQNLKAKFHAVGSLSCNKFEKIKGHNTVLNRLDFSNPYIQKLYPIKDLDIENNGVSLVDRELGTSGIYRSIDDGIFTGSVMQNQGKGYLISDNNSTYITPSSIHTDGIFEYKFEVTKPAITPMDSLIFFRATTPLSNYDGDNPPEYKVYDIQFSDPSGEPIAKYKDLILTGEQDYSKLIQEHWFTAVTEPDVFYAGTGVNRIDYPILNEPSGYSLSFKVDATCFHEPFSEGFTQGFEEGCDLSRKHIDTDPDDYLGFDGSPLSTRTQGYSLNPTNSLKISAIEIVNAGLNSGIIEDAVLNVNLMPQPTGQRLERILSPTKILTTSFTNDIYPTGIQSTWMSSPDADGNVVYSNSGESGGILTDRLANKFVNGWITLDSINPVSASGKLQLQFNNRAPQAIKQPTGGAFGFGPKYGGSDFGSAKVELVPVDDSFFVIEDITLRVSAKKASGSDDFPIDVVGYSDDGVLAITPQVGGFLQNEESGVGTVPTESGLSLIDDLGISTLPMSEKDSYFERSIIQHAAGDHYLIPSPVVTGTSFETYDIPLKIYQDVVELGRGPDYRMSSYFENLFLDIYPIPSGASIQKADLIIKYKPAGAIPLATAGRLSEKDYTRRNTRLYPDAKSATDVISNKINTSLSLIENIPHGYTYLEDTLKTNYSRRWRGCTGNVDSSAFDAEAFDFSVARSTRNHPFLLGFYDFNILAVNGAGQDIVKDTNGDTVSGVFNSNMSESLTRNIGLRFNSSGLFPSNVRSYKSIDWCQSGHELEGQILDSYDNALRCSGVDGHLNFGNTPTSSGFAVYTRFSPDVTVSGTSPNYNLWNSGVIFSKWDNGSNLEYALGYKDGYLTAYARNNVGTVYSISDTSLYSTYQYPLSTLVTYNASGDNKLRLYAYNELSYESTALCATSDAFVMHSGNSDLTFAHSAGSGVGFNCFIHEIGISDVNSSGNSNLIETGTPEASEQEESVVDFFKSQVINFSLGNDNLWEFVDEKTDDWKLGSYKYCHFSPDFDVMSKRIGKDYIQHTFYNHGQSYPQLTNMTLPESVPTSGIAYHTQIENDMLRINLSGREDRFFAVPPRIQKNLPRSYMFAEDALRVNTIVQHYSDVDIEWPDGKQGVKVIASLYTPRKESLVAPTTNYGLVSRDVHYVTPEDCWLKLKSKFTLGQYNDTESEPWSAFNKLISKREFEENYFSRDIDDMFVQYDLVYPSGSYEVSELKIHSLDISMNALHYEENVNTQLNIYNSGEAYREDSMNLVWASGSVKGVLSVGNFAQMPDEKMFGSSLTLQDLSCNLYTSGNNYTSYSDDMHLFASGWAGQDESLNLQIVGQTTHSGMLNHYTFGGYGNENTSIALVSEGYFANAKRKRKNIGMFTRGVNAEGSDVTISTDYVNMFILGSPPATSYPITASELFNLYTIAPPPAPTTISDNIGLFIEPRKTEETIETSLNMYAFHEQPIASEEGQLESFTWNGQSYGFEIYVDDNKYASIPANDEIRGVNTMCYGDCNTLAGIPCTETAIVTHDTTWYTPECVEGGIIRPVRVYTNPEAGYDKQYYGIRKYTNLIPYAPYSIKITGQSAGDTVLDVPREVSEWNYGKSEIDNGVISPEVNYSGIQILESVANRAADHKFGKSVSALGDLLAIGTPFADTTVGLDDIVNSDTASYPIVDHGKIYVYRRNTAPTGYNWTSQDDQANWSVEQELTLPVGWRRDYFTTETATFFDDENKLLPFTGEIRNWRNSGEGKQLGYSVDTAKVGEKEIIVAGAPGSKWTRTFPPIASTPVSIGLMVFNNELQPNIRSWQDVLTELKGRDVLYRYFSNPPIEFDIKIMLLEPHLGSPVPFEVSEEFNDPQPTFVTKHLTTRHWNLSPTSQEWIDADAVMLQEMKNIFHATFPIDASAAHSGIPPLMGFFIDDSISLGTNKIGYYDNGFKGALNKFIDYYKSYSYNNGVREFGTGSNGVAEAGPATEGYTNVTISSREANWVSQSVACLKELTEISKIKAAGKSKLIANDIGTFNPNASEFNNPPPSGGSVFIFEKDSANSSFELKQSIESPVTYTDDVSDRFGHDVSISKDGSIIVVGSPYTESAVQIFERNSFYDTILQNAVWYSLPRFLAAEHVRERANATFGEGYTLYNEYNEKRGTMNDLALAEYIYDQMSESLKYSFYRTYDVKPYWKIKELSYSNTYPDKGGSWSQLYGRYIPTPRLGYSVDTNDDGSLVAIGCPTDSLGERDKTITWFRYDQGQTQDWQWQNYTNAGAVRLLESRDYYPHKRKAVEFYKFGNLHEDLAPDEDKYLYFDNIKQTLESTNIDYSRTSFAEDQKIPEDAGMALIITPALNAASDEIIDNIKEWLSKGDRNLVLVGDDPSYEGNGVFNNSVNVINYILDKLDINMRIEPARNQQEALLNSANQFLNVRNSYVPKKSTPSLGEINGYDGGFLKGYGVGDIKHHREDIVDLYSCSLPYGMRRSSDPFAILEQIDGVSANEAGRKLLYRDLHDKCNLPIKHEGDLRAEYADQCVYVTPKGERTFITYYRNLSYAYGNFNTANWKCNDPDIPPITTDPSLRDKNAPVPMMAAYETVTKTVNVPEVPAREEVERYVSGYRDNFNTKYDFGSTPYSGISFMWTADPENEGSYSGNYVDIIHNVGNVTSQSLFFDPVATASSAGIVDALLGARATVDFQDVESTNPVGFFDTMGEENYRAGTVENSQVLLIATTYTERKDVLLSSENDMNLLAYFNLLAYGKEISPNGYYAKVAQLGGFTNRASYTDGYIYSDIAFQMYGLGIDTRDLNVDLDNLNDSSRGYDTAWIANTDQMPSDQDIAELKEFLDSGNKKLIITYGQAPNKEEKDNDLSPHMLKSAEVAQYICEQLGVTMKPRFLSGKNKYADLSDMSGRPELKKMVLLPPASIGVDDGDFIINTPPYRGRERKGIYFNHNLIPIELNSGKRLAFFNHAVYDKTTVQKGKPNLNTGITKVTFNVPDHSAVATDTREAEDDMYLFRMFFSMASLTPLEKYDITVYIENTQEYIRTNRETNQPIRLDKDTIYGSRVGIPDGDDFGEVHSYLVDAGVEKDLKTRQQYSIDFQAPSGSQINLYFTGYEHFRELKENPQEVRTVRLVGVSGVRIPLSSETTNKPIPIYDNRIITHPSVPAYSYEQDVMRQISTDSSKYCAENNSIVCAEADPAGYGVAGDAPVVADGPVVVAQQVYDQGGFFAGHRKSRVTVISDASMIQGRNVLDQDGNGIEGLAPFLASLYPYTYEFDDDEFFSFFEEDEDFVQTRFYSSSYKLISPERASPSRLVNALPSNSGLNARFGGYTSAGLGVDQYSDTEGKKFIITPPGREIPYQPFDGMLQLMEAIDPGKFRKLPEELQLPPSHFFSIPPYTYGGLTKAQYEQKWYVDEFLPYQTYWSSTSKIQDTYNGQTYVDAGLSERIPPLLRAAGYDHLDLDVFNSGYPGDLFGYSVKIHKDKLYVGSPFTPYSGESIVPWSGIVSNNALSGVEIGYNGGAGAVYQIEKVGPTGDGVGSIQGSPEVTAGLPWKTVKKFRPEELNVGFHNINAVDLSGIVGNHSYTDEMINASGFVSDMFGYDIDLAGDLMAISAPGHDFEVFFEENSGEFVNKAFNNQFHITSRTRHDLALSSNRTAYPNSGVTILNNGAIFTYENKINNWGSKTQEWSQLQKLNAQGGASKVQGSGENLFFGQSISLTRSHRSDADYILAAGGPNYDESSANKVGAVYTNDAMLRKLRPAFSHPDTSLAGRVFGNYKDQTEYVEFSFTNGSTPNALHTFEGTVFANEQGEIFIEASGQDKVERGYVVHRPFIKQIRGVYQFGEGVRDNIALYVDGKPFDASGVINLFSKAPDVGNVYNNIGLYGISSLDSSGILHLYASGINTDTSSGVLNVTTSGSLSGGTGILDFYGYGG